MTPDFTLLSLETNKAASDRVGHCRPPQGPLYSLYRTLTPSSIKAVQSKALFDATSQSASNGYPFGIPRPHSHHLLASGSQVRLLDSACSPPADGSSRPQPWSSIDHGPRNGSRCCLLLSHLLAFGPPPPPPHTPLIRHCLHV